MAVGGRGKGEEVEWRGEGGMRRGEEGNCGRRQARGMRGGRGEGE